MPLYIYHYHQHSLSSSLIISRHYHQHQHSLSSIIIIINQYTLRLAVPAPAAHAFRYSSLSSGFIIIKLNHLSTLPSATLRLAAPYDLLIIIITIKIIIYHYHQH
jgi:hypothetical protein